MIIFEIFSKWSSRPRGERITEAKNDIDEELNFHMESIVQEKIKQGKSKEVAEQEAVKQFGSIQSYSDQCLIIELEKSVAKNHYLTAGLLCLALVTGFLGLEFYNLKNTQSRILNNLTSQKQETQNPDNDHHRLNGSVKTEQGEPINNANLLIILKTWPENRFRQQNFHLKSNELGEFQFKFQTPQDGQYAVHVTAYKDGYGFKSEYKIKEKNDLKPIKKFQFNLPQSSPFTIQVLEQNGSPIKDFCMYPSSRKTSSGEDHIIYHQASEPIQLNSNENGKIPIRLFTKGEMVNFRIRIPGKDWQEQKVEIPQKGNLISLILNSNG